MPVAPCKSRQNTSILVRSTCSFHSIRTDMLVYAFSSNARSAIITVWRGAGYPSLSMLFIIKILITNHAFSCRFNRLSELSPLHHPFLDHSIVFIFSQSKTPAAGFSLWTWFGFLNSIPLNADCYQTNALCTVQIRRKFFLNHWIFDWPNLFVYNSFSFVIFNFHLIIKFQR